MNRRCLTIPQIDKDQLRFMFLSKHACSDGTPHPEDGTHAVYHHELLSTLQQIGLNITVADHFDAISQQPAVDFLISFYNRAGFRNSEMMAPLCGERFGIPYLGGAPMVRGLSDDKHYMKRVVQAVGVATPDWAYYPVGGLGGIIPPEFDDESLIVKPNASSASWGVAHVSGWNDARLHIDKLHQQGHDVVVERYIDGYEINVPIIGAVHPWYLPIVEYRSASGALRSYEEKRDLVCSDSEYIIHTDDAFERIIHELSAPIVRELWPFDHGRLEFRVERGSGKIWFIEVNLNCNLWSRKAIATAARHIGVSHPELIETIVCHSLMRQGLVTKDTALAA